ncbi:O-antigen polysaccharide polymerase Wzy, partial [Vibrio cholerae]
YFSISVSFFIFGRFLAVIISDLFNLDLPHVTSLSDLLQVTWMTSYVPEYKDQVKLVMIVNVFVLLMTLGYITSDHSKERQLKSLIIKDNLMLAIRFVFIFSSIYYSFDIIQSINKVISGGYLALYEQSDTTGSSSSIIKLVFYLTFSILIVFEKNKNFYFFVFLFIAIFSGLTGARGGLVTSFLTLVYAYFTVSEKKMSVVKVVISGFVCYILMIIVFQYSSRYEDSGDNSSIIYSFANFLYQQGITLSIVGYISFSDLVYPIQSLLQSFIPIFSRFYGLLSDGEPYYNASITTFISHSANPSMFFSGAGLGSSIIGEVYILLFKNLFLFSAFSFLFGFFLSKLEINSFSSDKSKIFIIAILPVFLFSPRSGLNVILISSIYVYFMLWFFLWINKVK